MADGTYKSIADCDHANLGPEMGGCPDCNYTVGTILAVTEDRLAAARAELERVRDMAKLHGQHHRQCVRLLAGLAHTTDADCNCWLSQLDNPPPHAAANLASLEPSQ